MALNNFWAKKIIWVPKKFHMTKILGLEFWILNIFKTPSLQMERIDPTFSHIWWAVCISPKKAYPLSGCFWHLPLPLGNFSTPLRQSWDLFLLDHLKVFKFSHFPCMTGFASDVSSPLSVQVYNEGPQIIFIVPLNYKCWKLTDITFNRF